MILYVRQEPVLDSEKETIPVEIEVENSSQIIETETIKFKDLNRNF